MTRRTKDGKEHRYWSIVENHRLSGGRVEQAFKTIKMDLSVRPVYHENEGRIEAQIFVSFLAYCLQVTLKQRLMALAPGLTPRSVLEKFEGIQMVNVHLPTTDGKELLLRRYTQPDKDQILLLSRWGLHLPSQPKPELLDNRPGGPIGDERVVKTFGDAF